MPGPKGVQFLQIVTSIHQQPQAPATDGLFAAQAGPFAGPFVGNNMQVPDARLILPPRTGGDRWCNVCAAR